MQLDDRCKTSPVIVSFFNWPIIILGSLLIPIKIFIPRNARISSEVVWNIVLFFSAYLSDSFLISNNIPFSSTVFDKTWIGDGFSSSIITMPSFVELHFSITTSLNCFLISFPHHLWNFQIALWNIVVSRINIVSKFIPQHQLMTKLE